MSQTPDECPNCEHPLSEHPIVVRGMSGTLASCPEGYEDVMQPPLAAPATPPGAPRLGSCEYADSDHADFFHAEVPTCVNWRPGFSSAPPVAPGAGEPSCSCYRIATRWEYERSSAHHQRCPMYDASLSPSVPIGRMRGETEGLSDDDLDRFATWAWQNPNTAKASGTLLLLQEVMRLKESLASPSPAPEPGTAFIEAFALGVDWLNSQSNPPREYVALMGAARAKAREWLASDPSPAAPSPGSARETLTREHVDALIAAGRDELPHIPTQIIAGTDGTDSARMYNWPSPSPLGESETAPDEARIIAFLEETAEQYEESRDSLALIRSLQARLAGRPSEAPGAK